MSAFGDLLDVVEHLVSTHPYWNQTLSRTEAFVKVAAARAELVAQDVADDESDLGK